VKYYPNPPSTFFNDFFLFLRREVAIYRSSFFKIKYTDLKYGNNFILPYRKCEELYFDPKFSKIRSERKEEQHIFAYKRILYKQ